MKAAMTYETGDPGVLRSTAKPILLDKRAKPTPTPKPTPKKDSHH